MLSVGPPRWRRARHGRTQLRAPRVASQIVDGEVTMRRIQVALVAAVLAVMGLGACSSGGGNSRTIEVDYHSDDFAGSFLGYYPREVTVKPGMTLKFHQTWTGEPHSVSTGTLPTEGIKPVLSL